MKALIREINGIKEIYPEYEWSLWTKNNLDREIEINGWTLVEDYQPETN